MKSLSLIAALSAVLVSGCASGTYVSDSQRAGFQKGSTTQAQVESELGKPNMTASLVSGGTRDIYTYRTGYPQPIDYVPVVSLVAGSPWPHTTIVNFDFSPQGVLVDTSVTRYRY